MLHCETREEYFAEFMHVLAPAVTNGKLAVTDLCRAEACEHHRDAVRQGLDREPHKAALLVVFREPPHVGADCGHGMEGRAEPPEICLRYPGQREESNGEPKVPARFSAPWPKLETNREQGLQDLVLICTAILRIAEHHRLAQPQALGRAPGTQSSPSVASVQRSLWPTQLPRVSARPAGRILRLAALCGGASLLILILLLRAQQLDPPGYSVLPQEDSNYLQTPLDGGSRSGPRQRYSYCPPDDTLDLRLSPGTAYHGYLKTQVVRRFTEGSSVLLVDFHRDANSGALRLRGKNIVPLLPGEEADLDIELRFDPWYQPFSRRQVIPITVVAKRHCGTGK